VDIFIYKGEGKDKTDAIIVGSVSLTSDFSFILSFKKITDSEDSSYPIFRYSGRITATVLGESKFYLDAINIFNKYLIFSNEKTLFVTNVEKFIEYPSYMSPIMFKKINLNMLIRRYSSNVYRTTGSISSILLLDHCLSYISVFISTRYFGTIMIEVDKSAFLYDEWTDIPVERKNPNDTMAIINDGRLLYNIYSYDYDTMISVMNQHGIVMLIRYDITFDANKMQSQQQNGRFIKSPLSGASKPGIKNESGNGYYILRVINLLAHEESMVYRDFQIMNVNECPSINFIDEFECSMTISIL
jgi:hypothetical protein